MSIKEIIFYERPFHGKYEVGIFSEQGGKSVVAQPLEFTENEDFLTTEPTTVLSRDEMQAMFNQLWKLGFRPMDGTGNSGHIEAMRNHLEDMRKLVFDNKPLSGNTKSCET